jgi:hypothetical protein
MKDESWESTFFRVISMIKNDQRLEPILKIILLQKVSDVACQGSESLKRSFVRFHEILNSVPIDPAVPWMDPQNEDARRVRELAVNVLNRLPSLQELGRAAAAELRALRAPLGDSHEWVGWAVRDDDGKWQCHIGPESTGDGGLFVATPAPKEKSLTWTAVGHLKGNTGTFDLLRSAALLQGRPVFLVRAPVSEDKSNVERRNE